LYTVLFIKFISSHVNVIRPKLLQVTDFELVI